MLILKDRRFLVSFACPGPPQNLDVESTARCLAIDAPAAEDKLACLSEIAQEHGVEWDAAGAAADMLPSVRCSPTPRADRLASRAASLCVHASSQLAVQGLLGCQIAQFRRGLDLVQ